MRSILIAPILHTCNKQAKRSEERLINLAAHASAPEVHASSLGRFEHPVHAFGSATIALLREKADLERLTTPLARAEGCITIPQVGRVPRGAPEGRSKPKSQPRRALRNAPSVPANKAVRGARAQRSGHKHRCEHSPALCPPRCAAIPRTWYRAREAAVFTDWNAVFNPRPAQHGIAADRFAREIVRFWKLFSSALAAAECQAVGPQSSTPAPNEYLFSTAASMPRSTVASPAPIDYHAGQAGVSTSVAIVVW